MSGKIAADNTATRKAGKAIKPVSLAAPQKLKAKKASSPCRSEINVELLLKVKQAILDEPYRFNMGFWIEPIGENYLWKTNGIDSSSGLLSRKLLQVPKDKQEEASCGTAACIGGHAVLASGYDYTSDEDMWSRFGSPTKLGRKLLWLRGAQVIRLFSTAYWPSQFETAYNNAESFEERAKVAAARIDHFIATCGKE